MKCKDVLDKKLPAAGENEITWHESRWIVRLLSDSNRCLVRKIIIFYNMKCPVMGRFWFGGSVKRSYQILWSDLMIFRLTAREGWLVIMVNAGSRMTFMKTWFVAASWGWNLKSHDMGIASRRWELGRHRTEMDKCNWWMLSDRKVEMGF